MCFGHQLIASHFQIHPSWPLCETKIVFPLTVGLMLSLGSRGCWKDTEGGKRFSSGACLCSPHFAPIAICHTGHSTTASAGTLEGNIPAGDFSVSSSAGHLPTNGFPYTRGQNSDGTYASSPPSSRSWLQRLQRSLNLTVWQERSR